MASTNPELFQFVPFSSFVNPSFWHALTDMKITVDRLDDATKQIYGRYTNKTNVGSIFEVDSTSFNSKPDADNIYINIRGTILNKNTIEEFKSIDKTALIHSIGEMVWANIKQKTWIEDPSCLLNFFILSFADLKKFHYFYWFAFPAPRQPIVHLVKPTTNIRDHFDANDLQSFHKCYKNLSAPTQSFFLATKDIGSFKIHSLSSVFDKNVIKQMSIDVDINDTYFVFMDPSNNDNPGWPLRTFLAAILEHCPFLANSHIKVIGLRSKINGGIDDSLVYTLSMPETDMATPEWVGWERNEKGNFGPRLANMAASMDPIKLADASSDLNIKLMKWRLVPDLDLEVMKNTKCLLLGAGTLGCHVARNLLAWGFRHVTFLDNGKVSYSNPTRQVLFNHKDCLNGGRKKAEAAADNLKDILPTVVSQGITAHIPMPGHPVGESLKEETLRNIDVVSATIAAHDAVFLLLDTREARWLPTLLAAHHGKIVINAALGFDSYLVMRHGGATSDTDSCATVTSQCVAGGDLGCYYCSDVTAPGNSQKDRTLDQQCTVTRPAAAAIAGALAVEILVALLQHPLRIDAPAVYNLSSDSDIPAHLQGVLGPIPHSIRGFLHSYQSVAPTCAKFKQCIACSDIVLKKYREEGTAFLMNVFNSGKYLEEITGLDELHLIAEMTDIMTFSDEDEE